MAETPSDNMRPIFRTLLMLAGSVSVAWSGESLAQSNRPIMAPHYYPYTIALPQDRAWIRSLPMEQRPDRPLHFYGNLVRQNYSVKRPNYAPGRRLPIGPATGISRRR